MGSMPCPGTGKSASGGQVSNCSSSNSNGCLCSPKTVQQLADKYNGSNYNSECVTLTKIEVPMGDSFSWTSMFVITGKSSCFETVHQPSCFNSSSLTPQCSWRKTWIDLGVDYFPRYVSHLECRGSNVCNALGRGPNYLEVLHRQGRCDAQGADVWEKVRVEQQVNFICNCLQKNQY